MKYYAGIDIGGTKSAVLLIDEKGKVLHVWENVKVKGHAEAVLEYLKSNA